jgi:predicted RNA binding protein YcfA (HicA-like mRNA interferase family)
MTCPIQLLKDAGAVHVRTGKHQIWRLPNRRIIVVPLSPSDHRAMRNLAAQIRRSLRAA